MRRKVSLFELVCMWFPAGPVHWRRIAARLVLLSFITQLAFPVVSADAPFRVADGAGGLADALHEMCTANGLVSLDRDGDPSSNDEPDPSDPWSKQCPLCSTLRCLPLGVLAQEFILFPVTEATHPTRIDTLTGAETWRPQQNYGRDPPKHA
jgi:hypothetical protein